MITYSYRENHKSFDDWYNEWYDDDTWISYMYNDSLIYYNDETDSGPGI